jgi:hypothetical protein
MYWLVSAPSSLPPTLPPGACFTAQCPKLHRQGCIRILQRNLADSCSSNLERHCWQVDRLGILYMQVLQDDYNGALNGTGSLTVSQVLASYEGTQVPPPPSPLIHFLNPRDHKKKPTARWVDSAVANSLTFGGAPKPSSPLRRICHRSG